MIHSQSPEETEALARLFAPRLQKGDVVWLDGDLGAGKTAFVRGLAAGLGVQDRITSPTFALVHEHLAAVPLFHFDLYRLSGWDELIELGWDDYRDRGICAVEWCARLKGLEPGYHVRFERTGETGRTITITDGSGKELCL